MSTAVMPTSLYDLNDLVLKQPKSDLQTSFKQECVKLSWEEVCGEGQEGLRSSLPISLATLLDNLMTNPHRRLDRTQSEPSKTPLINVNTSRYKTELCRPFEENGMCKYGDKCQFAHGEHELRGLVRHPKYKTELCRTFHTVGFCPYGPRCHFIHNADEARGSGKSRPRPLSLDTSPASSLGSLTPPPVYYNSSPPNSPPPPPVSPDSRLPVFNRISAPNTPLLSYPLGFRELLA